MSEVVLETKELDAESSTALAAAKDFKIATPQQYVESGERLKGIKALMKKIDEVFDEHIKDAFDNHRKLVAKKRAQQMPLQTAEALIKRAILGYQQEQEKIRREAEAKAQEAVRKEREKLEAKAVKLDEKGKTEKAESTRASAGYLVAPMIPRTVPKLAGISNRETYSAVVTDKTALADAVAGGRRKAQIAYQGPERRAGPRVPLNAMDPNMPFLNGQARAMKETLNYPGVKAVATTGLAA